jgi:peptidyl-tRNA hydrolase
MRVSKDFIALVVKNYLDLTPGQNRQVAKYVLDNLTPQERRRIQENALQIYHAAKAA